ncbi:CKLF-like MARVEL transmembrane domain-containing protein 7 isoform X2 [Saimiri boliviensis]|uniref:CKLF-like MARVEL transmembrane domain-containing protein 7 isoform X2 n=1 Tax=Saimiri boliviensis TaxID=27679 RepID=UPI003D770E26
MSHGAGLVRTTCSSGGGALGPGAGAAQPGASPLEGLLDPGYPRTHAALLKVAQMVTLLIAFICVRSSLWTDYSAYSYFEVVTICDLIMILAFYLVHLFRFYRVLTCISWPLSELLHYLIGTLLLLIASIVAASKSYSQSGLVAGAVRTFWGAFRNEFIFKMLIFFLMGEEKGLVSGAFLSQNRQHLPSSSHQLSPKSGEQRLTVPEGGVSGLPANPQPQQPGLTLLQPLLQSGDQAGFNSHTHSDHLFVGCLSPMQRQILWPLLGPEGNAL